MKKFFTLITLLIAQSFLIYTYAQVDKTLEVEDGYAYYELCKFTATEGFIRGVALENGRTIIPLSRGYEYVFPRVKDGQLLGFRVVKNNPNGYDWEGWCSPDGKEIISPSRHYITAWPIVENDQIIGFEVHRERPNNVLGLKGRCSAEGKEIVPCIYDGLYEEKAGDFLCWRGMTPDGRTILYNNDFSRVIIPLGKYDNIFVYEENKRVWYRVYKEGYKFQGLCSTDGTEIIAPTYYTCTNLTLSSAGDFIITVKDPDVSIINSNGQSILSFRAEGVEGAALNYDSGKFWIFVWNKLKKRGVYDATGKVIVPLKEFEEGSVKYNKAKNSIVFIPQEGKERVLCSMSVLSANKLKSGTIDIIYNPNKPKINLGSTNQKPTVNLGGQSRKSEDYSFENVVKEAKNDILEISEPFFKENKTYSVRYYNLLMLNDLKEYEKGKFFITVKDKVVTIKFDDGSGSSHKIVSGIKKCTVRASDGGSVTIPMYVLDNGMALRAIQSKSERRITIYEYHFNNPTQKYILGAYYVLYDN